MKISVILEALTGTFETDMNRASKTAQKRMKEIEKNIKASAQVIGVAFVAAVSAIAFGVKQAIDNADKLDEMSHKLGVSAEALSGFAYAAKMTGTDIDGLSIGLKKLAKNMAEALDPKSSQAKLFDALGVEVLDKATGQLKALDDILPEIADKFRTLNDDTLEAALAQEIFGKAGVELVEFLNLGSVGIEEMRQRLRDLGGELSNETAAAAAQFKDRVDDLSIASNGLFMTLAADLLPELNSLVVSMVNVTKEGSELRGVVQGLVTVFHYVVDVCRDVDSLWRALVSSGIALYNVADNLSRLNPGAALANWMGANEGADSWAENWREAKAAIGQAGDAIRDYGKDYRAAAEEVSKAPPILWNPSEADLGNMGVLGKSANEVALEKRLQALLGNSGGGAKPKKTGKSDAEKQAEQLEEAFQRMQAQMAETIALYGQEGEAAKVRYDLEHGELKELAEGKKQSLLLQAKTIDRLKEEAEETERLNKLEEERLETIKEAHASVAQTLSDMQFEIDLMGKSNAQRVAEIELRRIAAGLTDQERESAKAAIEAKAAEVEALQKQVGAMDEFRGSFVDFVTEADLSADAFKSFADTVVEQLRRMAAEWLSAQLFGEMGSSGTGSAGGWLSSLFSIFTGSGSSGSSNFGIPLLGDNVPGFALGTDYAPGGYAWVGESGRELVDLPEGSRVIPNHELGNIGRGGGFVQENHFHLGAPTEVRTQDQITSKMGFEAQRSLRRNGVPA